ncbi:DUF1102 domain-containing protein [Halopenitus persicus]|uniref:DUF1102 domain-containing protein n=1 Tax=Halopenitus persicus TaxID=1048396 RepID=A0A1H3IVM4_9EURY|nr:DUF1102 domain-containing protein [Halopenitus persicus]SDY31617.1 Protein of unknown function [Halopenitus persicus]
MARPKGKLLALVLVFGAITVVTATGAFTTVEAERTAEVNVSGDANALLGLSEGPDNGEYVTTDGGEIQIELGAPESADGVNINAYTEINNMLNVTNNGQNAINLYVNTTGSNAGHVSLYNGTPDTGTNITGDTNTVTLNPGDTIQVSMEIDTRDSGLDQDAELIDTIEFVANDAS